MTQPMPQESPFVQWWKGLSGGVRVMMAVAGAMPVILLVMALFGYTPDEFWESVRGLFGAAHNCPAGEHWSSALDRCFPN